MKRYVIYKVTNLVNGKIYIGSTRNCPMRRWKTHLYESKKGNPAYFYNAIRKHGYDNFYFEIILNVLKVEDIETMEKYFIDLYDSKNDKKGYNQHDPIDGAGEYLSTASKLAWSDPVKKQKRIDKMKEGSKYRRKGILAVSIIDGSIIRFQSVREGIAAGFATSSIMNSLKRRCITGQNYVWFYDEEKTDQYYQRVTKELIGDFKPLLTLPIICIDIKTNEIQEFSDAYEAKEKGYVLKEIHRVLKGERKSANGKVWKLK